MDSGSRTPTGTPRKRLDVPIATSPYAPAREPVMPSPYRPTASAENRPLSPLSDLNIETESKENIAKLVKALTERLDETEGRAALAEQQFMSKTQIFRTTLDSMKAATLQKEAEYEHLKEAYFAQEDEMRRLMAQLTAVQAAQSSLVRSNSQAGGLGSELVSKTEALRAATAEIAELRAKIALLGEQIAESSDLLRDNERLRTLLHQRENEVLTLGAALAKAGTASANASNDASLRSTIAGLESSLTAARAEAETAGRAAMQLQADVTTLRLKASLPDAAVLETVRKLEEAAAGSRAEAASSKQQSQAMAARVEMLVAQCLQLSEDSERAREAAALDAMAARRRAFAKGTFTGVLLSAVTAAVAVAVAWKRFGVTVSFARK